MKKPILVLLSAVASALAACTTVGHPGERQATEALAPMVRPEINAGDKWYALMSGEPLVVTTLSRDNDMVQQRSSDGCQWYMIAWGFAPPAEWNACDSIGNGTQKITEIKGDVWPLQVGKKISYSFYGSNDTGNLWVGKRDCSVADQVRIKTVSGAYETYKVVCDDPWTTRTWYISPEVGATVYFVHYPKTKNEATVMEMTRYETASPSL